MTRTLARLALAAVAGGALWSLRRQATSHRIGKPRAKHPAVQTWEGEGGALPVTGGQMAPSPVLPGSGETG